METKICNMCEVEKPLSDYRVYSGKYYSNRCIKCINRKVVDSTVGKTMQHTCVKCGKSKQRQSFVKDKRAKLGITNTCLKCYRPTRKKDYQKHKEKRNLTCKKGWLRTKYSLTIEEYEQMLIDQNNSCAICNRNISELKMQKLHIDHNHSTKQVRGLLCPSCNRLIGVSIESIDVLKSAIQYLEKHNK